MMVMVRLPLNYKKYVHAPELNKIIESEPNEYLVKKTIMRLSDESNTHLSYDENNTHTDFTNLPEKVVDFFISKGLDVEFIPDNNVYYLEEGDCSSSRKHPKWGEFRIAEKHDDAGYFVVTWNIPKKEDGSDKNKIVRIFDALPPSNSY